jgi:hypothetical protein
LDPNCCFQAASSHKRREFLHRLENKFRTRKQKTKDVPGKLSDGILGTVSVFYIKEQIISLLTNDDLM